MFDMPPTLVLALASILAIALFLFFWRAVKDISLPYKIVARSVLAVILILPLGLAFYSLQFSHHEKTSSAPPTDRERQAPVERAPGESDDISSLSEPRKPATPPGSNGGKAKSKPAAPRRSAKKERAGEQPNAMPAPTAAAPAPPPALAPTGAGALSEEKQNQDWTVVPIYFGTDREEKSDTQRLTYDWKRAKRLELGRALVTIPNNHVIPKVERPWALRIPYLNITIYEEAEDPKKHFTMSELKALSRVEFLALVRKKISSATRYKDHALIFIHGYNNQFDNAAFRTAQIAYDLKFDSAPFLYSWPSSGTLQGYTYDRESAGQAEPYLREFLDLVVNKTGAKKVSIIAHSMGNQLLLRVLQDLKRSKPDEVIISQLILAAPDVDRDSFENIMKSIKGIAQGVTLYTASNDAALQASRQFNGGVARAGDIPQEGPLVIDGVDTIDATATSLDSVGINHSTYAENNALLTDVGLLIQTGQRPPDKRIPTLERVKTPSGDYWRYPAPSPERTAPPIDP